MSPTWRGLAGATGAWAAQRVLLAAPPGGSERWQRRNHRGRPVTLLSGPALALAAAGTTRTGPAGLLAGLLSGLVGAYDDIAGARPVEQGTKGFGGHLAALRHGQLTGGTVKVAGIGAGGLAAAALLRDRQPGSGPADATDLLVGGAVVAGSANLLNLLDLRPGRALKVGLLAAVALRDAGPAAAVAALLPGDLAERTMLGDAGANALGAVLGTALLARLPSHRARLVALAVLGAFTGASELVSFTAVIAGTPPLDWLDRLGRR